MLEVDPQGGSNRNEMATMIGEMVEVGAMMTLVKSESIREELDDASIEEMASKIKTLIDNMLDTCKKTK